MIELNIEHMKKLEAVLGETPKLIPIAASRAINRAAQTARTEAARKLRQQYYVRHGDVLKTFKIKSAYVGNLSASVISKGKLAPLSAFKVTPRTVSPKRKRPIRAAVKKGGGKPLKSAFVARTHSGHVGVFERAGKKRYPIRELYGPSIPQMIDNEEIVNWVEQQAQEKLDERLDHEIKQAIGGIR